MEDYKEPKYLSSNSLMEAVRALGYKQQYKVFEAFFNMMVEEGLGIIVKGVICFMTLFW